MDHIQPRHRGGKDARRNLRGLCHRCHHFRHRVERFVNPEMSLASRLIIALEVCRGASDCGIWRVVSGLMFRLFIRRDEPIELFAWSGAEVQ